MTILITGSAGHLGEALMRTLWAAGRPAVGVAGVSAVIHSATHSDE